MAARFDEVVHAPHRLRICTLLSRGRSVEFGVIRDVLGVADSVTSKQLKILVDAGYVTLSKPTGTGRRPRTWASLTPQGRAAFQGHLAALRELVAAAGPDAEEDPEPDEEATAGPGVPAVTLGS